MKILEITLTILEMTDNLTETLNQQAGAASNRKPMSQPLPGDVNDSTTHKENDKEISFNKVKS